MINQLESRSTFLQERRFTGSAKKIMNIDSIEEIQKEIERLRNKKPHTIYDFNKIQQLTKLIKEKQNGTKSKEDEG